MVRTELGDWTLPVLSRRVQPQLDFADLSDLGTSPTFFIFQTPFGTFGLLDEVSC